MRKSLIITFLLVAFVSVHAQKTKGLHSIAFYNVENLFDTIPDPGKDDGEYLPYGSREWNTEKYTAKLTNISRVLSELGREKTPQGPALIGLAEVENHYVLQDLVREPSIADKKYEIVHFEGEDKRGIDCALLYDPSQFKLTSAVLAPHRYQNNDTTHKTRGFLIVNGKVAKSKVCVIVNHWPSRGAASPVRVWAAQQVRELTDSIAATDKKLKIIVMGDMNDDPMDESMAVALGAKKQMNEVGARDFYNPWWEILEDKGVGTLMYRGKWNLFDQIVVSKNLLQGKGLIYDSSEVFIRDYLIQQDGNYKGSPLRTHGGRLWLNGYSDHLPTIIYLKK